MPANSALSLPDSSAAAAPNTTDAVELHHFVKDIDIMMTAIDIQRIEQLSFVINDIQFHVSHKKDSGEGASTVCIQAVLGYLPFSIQGDHHRHAIRTILGATHNLVHVRFGIDHHGRIFAAGNFTADTLTSPDFIFYPLTRFLQEAQPFIDLIGKYF